MTGFPSILLILSFFGYLIYLVMEARIHRNQIRKIQLRITVGGTRGKTSTVRLLAAVLREAGMTVLAKTTGTEARYILPDGSEEEVSRRGFPNIIEQKKLIRKAVKSKADCVVAEMMSIHPENHRTETRHLLQPHLTLLTNIRPDHLDVSGKNRRDLEIVYQNDEWEGAHIIRGWGPDEHPQAKGIDENRDLVIRAARHLGIEDSVIEEGFRTARMDTGAPLIIPLSKSPVLFLVNAFAANDPLSTRLIMDHLRPTIPIKNPRIIALLSLRSDRPERSEQWLKYLEEEGKDLFDKIYLTGTHARILNRKLNRTQLLKSKNPNEILTQIIQNTESPTICFGIGNIQGIGLEIITRAKGEQITRARRANNASKASN